MRGFLQLTLLLAVIFLAGTTPAAAAVGAMASIRGRGASLPAPIYAQWSYFFRVVNKNIKITYDATSSSDGFSSILTDTAEFAGSDIPLTAAQRFVADGRIVSFPSLMTSVSFAVHAGVGRRTSDQSAPPLPLVFSRRMLVRIFAPGRGVRTPFWDDPELVSLNPGVPLPHERIRVLVRRTSSGTSANVIEAVRRISIHEGMGWSGADDGDVAAAGIMDNLAVRDFDMVSTAAWPIHPLDHEVLSGSEDDLLQRIRETPFSIGYGSFAAVNSDATINSAEDDPGLSVNPTGADDQDTASQLGSVRIRNAAGVVVGPEDMSAVGNFAPRDEYLNVDLLDRDPEAAMWPVTIASYILLRRDSDRCELAQGLVEFLSWVQVNDLAVENAESLGATMPFASRRGVLRALDLLVRCRAETGETQLASLGKGHVTVAGGSLFQPAAIRISPVMEAALPDHPFVYSGTGSGTATRLLESGGAEFILVESAVSRDRLAAAGAFQFPVAAAPVVIAFNVPGFKSVGVTDEVRTDLRLSLSLETVMGIFNGDIVSWGDPRIVRDNWETSSSLPQTEPIRVVVRSDSSGTSHAFTAGLNGASQPDSGVNFGIPTSQLPAWPASFTHRARGNGGVTALVKETAFSITYCSLGAAADAGLAVADLITSGGEPVSPTLDAIGRVQATFDYQEVINIIRAGHGEMAISNSRDPLAWPLMAGVYGIVITSMSDNGALKSASGGNGNNDDATAITPSTSTGNEEDDTTTVATRSLSPLATADDVYADRCNPLAWALKVLHWMLRSTQANNLFSTIRFVLASERAADEIVLALSASQCAGQPVPRGAWAPCQPPVSGALPCGGPGRGLCSLEGSGSEQEELSLSSSSMDTRRRAQLSIAQSDSASTVSSGDSSISQTLRPSAVQCMCASGFAGASCETVLETSEVPTGLIVGVAVACMVVLVFLIAVLYKRWSRPPIWMVSRHSFVLGEIIGAGGYATVFDGRWNGSNVAIKVVPLKRGGHLKGRDTILREVLLPGDLLYNQYAQVKNGRSSKKDAANVNHTHNSGVLNSGALSTGRESTGSSVLHKWRSAMASAATPPASVMGDTLPFAGGVDPTPSATLGTTGRRSRPGSRRTSPRAGAVASRSGRTAAVPLGQSRSRDVSPRRPTTTGAIATPSSPRTRRVQYATESTEPHQPELPGSVPIDASQQISPDRVRSSSTNDEARELLDQDTRDRAENDAKPKETTDQHVIDVDRSASPTSRMLTSQLIVSEARRGSSAHRSTSTHNRSKLSRFNSAVKTKTMSEVSIISRLRHPNVTFLVAACVHEGYLYLLTEKLEGGSVYNALGNDLHDMSIRTRIGIALDAAKGLYFLHAQDQRVLHGDIKSSNILLDAHGRAKLCDFGLSMTGAERRVREGTLPWTAPEVLAGEKYTEASDMYSFGIVLWELQANYRDGASGGGGGGAVATRGYVSPWGGKTAEEIKDAVLRGERPPMTPDANGFGVGYAELVRLALSAQPGDRPTCEDIVEALSELEEESERQQSARDKDARRSLLLLDLPPSIRSEISRGVEVTPVPYKSASVIFTDITDFTARSSKLSASEVSDMLAALHDGLFDSLCATSGAFHVESIGDAYIAATGFPRASPLGTLAGVVGGGGGDGKVHGSATNLNALGTAADLGTGHNPIDAAKATALAYAMCQAARRIDIMIRAGVHTGPVVASVVGRTRPKLTLLGDTVNAASRMETLSTPGMTTISSTTHAAVLQAEIPGFEFSQPEMREVKGKGSMRIYRVLAAPSPDSIFAPGTGEFETSSVLDATVVSTGPGVRRHESQLSLLESPVQPQQFKTNGNNDTCSNAKRVIPSRPATTSAARRSDIQSPATGKKGLNSD